MDWTQILGIAAAILTTAANVPQAIKIIKTGSTESISAMTYALLLSGVILWTLYGVYRDDLPIILANGVSALLAATILTIKLIAKKKENQNDFPV